MALGLGSGAHVCSGLGVNARVSVLGFLRFIRRKRRRLRLRMSIPRYSFRVIVLYVGGGVSVVSELELSGVPGMSSRNAGMETGWLGGEGVEGLTLFMHK